MISRPLAGLACKIRLNLRQYQAVAVVATEGGNVIRLTHREPGLSIDIADMAAFDDAEDYRDRLAMFLDLPTLMLAGGGAAEGRSAKPAVRRTKTNSARRPRFLSRRKGGDVVSIRKIEGRELIARQ